MAVELYTIGHSSHSLEEFMQLLALHSIQTVCDVRSQPYSKHTPQFNREVMENQLAERRIAYVFLGRELGARSDDAECCVDGRLQLARLAETETFQRGIQQLRERMASSRTALLCAEKDPLACHRTILICRCLRSEDVRIRHILDDGAIEEHSHAERRLLRLLKIPQENLFESIDELIQRAYDIQGRKIASIGYPATAGAREAEGHE